MNSYNIPFFNSFRPIDMCIVKCQIKQYENLNHFAVVSVTVKCYDFKSACSWHYPNKEEPSSGFKPLISFYIRFKTSHLHFFFI